MSTIYVNKDTATQSAFLRLIHMTRIHIGSHSEGIVVTEELLSQVYGTVAVRGTTDPVGVRPWVMGPAMGHGSGLGVMGPALAGLPRPPHCLLVPGSGASPVTRSARHYCRLAVPLMVQHESSLGHRNLGKHC